MQQTDVCFRLPSYVKALLTAVVVIGVVTGMVFLTMSHHKKAPLFSTTTTTTISPPANLTDDTEYTPYSVPQLLAKDKDTRDMSNMEFSQSLQGFSNNLFDELRQSNVGKNIILSPLSIETCLSMVRMGAEGETAVEMDSALNVTGYSGDSLANNYLSLLANYEKSDFIHMANKIYVNKNYELQDSYKEMVSQKFLASAETIDFTQINQAANDINVWVESKTNHLIRNIVAPEMFSADTMSVLLSAIHFQDEWKTQFDNCSTKEADFYVDDNTTVRVQMMHKLSVFGYNSLPELNANMVRMPYKNSNLSMVILLPNTRTGLSSMLENLKKNFPAVTEKLKSSGNTNVDVYLPKFKAEIEVELNESLKKMGMKKVFQNGEFQNMLKTPKPLGISKVVHKAFIDVHEVGTKAAAATGAVVRSRRSALGYPMICDHPFYYMIVNPDFVPLFQGVVVDFPNQQRNC